METSHLSVFVPFVISLLFTAFFIPRILFVSYKKQLFDFVDVRKVHSGGVPRLGGVAFVPSIIMSLALVVGVSALDGGKNSLYEITDTQVSFGLCAMLLLYFSGIADDLVGLRYRAKFVFQTVSAIFVVASGIYFNDFQGLLGLGEISPLIGMPFTVLAIVSIVNAINLIDGIDGLASGLSIIASLFLGVMFYSAELWGFAMLAFCTLGTLLPFFYYNVFGRADRRRKIFMGDTGSQCIGLILAILAVRFSMVDSEARVTIDGSVMIAFSMLLVPLLDVVRVMIHRFRIGHSLFLPDKNHIHHKLLALGMPHKIVMLTILSVAMFFIVLNLALLPIWNINLVLITDIVLYTLGNLWLSRLVRQHKSSES